MIPEVNKLISRVVGEWMQQGEIDIWAASKDLALDLGVSILAGISVTDSNRREVGAGGDTALVGIGRWQWPFQCKECGKGAENLHPVRRLGFRGQPGGNTGGGYVWNA